MYVFNHFFKRSTIPGEAHARQEIVAYKIKERKKSRGSGCNPDYDVQLTFRAYQKNRVAALVKPEEAKASFVETGEQQHSMPLGGTSPTQRTDVNQRKTSLRSASLHNQ